MEMYVYKKDYFKESKEVQTAIVKSMTDLYKRIKMYEVQKIDFDKIYNDDNVKYDKHGRFYTYKSQKSNVQLRILYSYMIVDNTPTILIADFFIKKKSKKDYIKKFDYVNDIDPYQIYADALFLKEI